MIPTNVEKEHHPNGQKASEYHYIVGEGGYNSYNYHREDGPATQCWYENGQKWIEAYCINGLVHREDGPAFTEWDEYGQKKNEEYYLDNERVYPKSLDDLKRMVKLMIFK